MGDLIAIHCKSAHDAIQIADLSQRRAGTAAVVEAPAQAALAESLATAPGERVALRFNLRRLALQALIPVAFIVGNGALVMFAGVYYPVLFWLGVVLLPFFGWRLLDRRVRLAIASDGISYRPWGEAIVPWSEIESVRFFEERAASYVDVRPRQPEVFAARLPALERLNGSVLAWARPRFAIDLASLDRDPEAVFALIAQRVSAGPAS